MRTQNPTAPSEGELRVAGAHADESHRQASLEPYARLVKLVARAFYDDLGFTDNELTAGCVDNQGIAVVVLDRLTQYEWVCTEDLAASLQIKEMQLLQILHFLEEEKFLERKMMKSTVAAAGTVDMVGEGRKIHLQTYWCLNYPQIYDVTRYKLLRMKEKMKSQLDSRNAPPQYLCSNCKRSYPVFDAIRLPIQDDNFHCESCNGELVAKSEGEIWDSSRKGIESRSAKYFGNLERMKEQLKPLATQIAFIKTLPAPQFGYLQEGEGASSETPVLLNAGQSTLRPLLGETMAKTPVQTFHEKDENACNTTFTCSKILPAWLVRKGMLPLEDHIRDNSKQATQEYIQREYIKAYTEAMKKRELEEAAKRDSSSPVAPDSYVARNLGSKSKRQQGVDSDGVPSEEELLADLEKDGQDEERLQHLEVLISAREPKQRRRRVSSWRDGD